MPPEIYVTLKFFPYISRKPLDLPGTQEERVEVFPFTLITREMLFLPFRENFKISLKPRTKERFEVFFLKIRDAWNAVYYPHYID